MIKSKLYAIVFIILIIVALIIIGYTSTEKDTTMHIKAAELTKKEQAIYDLAKAEGTSPIYEFTTDKNATSVQIVAYKLNNNKWETSNKYGPVQLEDPTGRILLRFDKIANGLSMKVQTGNNAVATVSAVAPQEDFTGLGVATSYLSMKTEIEYEKEIPLVIQTAQELGADVSHSSSNMRQFFEPETFSDASYKHVYAVTVLFSKEPF